ncbi:transposase [Escherichia coli]|nr:transposase [Escherichia coli]EEC8098800.1 transposase [Escherichia coli]EEC8724966.1 transposase [Escherichia coli]EEC9605104.1 transposase [Escherichia coli]EEQ4113740.1 transposase [Escherichia coli]
MTGILLGQELRKRKTPQEKIAIIQQTMEPGMTVSHVARLHGIQPSLLFKWKKQYLEGSLTAVAAGEDVVPASELAAAIKQIKELQRLLGKKSKRLVRTVLIFTESSDQLSRATDRVPGLPASPGYVQ